MTADTPYILKGETYSHRKKIWLKRMLSSFMLVPLETGATFGYLRDYKSLAEAMHCGVSPTDSIRRFLKSTTSHVTPRFSVRKESARSHKSMAASFIATVGWRDAARGRWIRWQRQFSSRNVTFNSACSELLMWGLQTVMFNCTFKSPTF